MSTGLLIGGGALALVALIAGGNKPNNKTNESNKDEGIFDDAEPITTITQPKKRKKRKKWKGKYKKSVRYNQQNIGKFKPSFYWTKLLIAIKNSNLTDLKKLYSILNKDRVRLMHNYFLEKTQGKRTIYEFIVNSSYHPAIKQSIINLLTNSGVGKNIKA